MLPWLDSIRFRRPNTLSWVSSRMFRFIFGLMFVYVGINLVGDLVRSGSKANEPLKAMVHKYDAVEIVSTVASDIGGALSDSVEKNGTPTTILDANHHAKNASASIEDRFRAKIPAVHNAFQEIMNAVFAPIKESIRYPHKN